ncbi:LysM peptidoglycan-binding domain-containing protein [Desulfonema limicola]|nr:LysM domain-containing protein [Desulfonema limicola]
MALFEKKPDEETKPVSDVSGEEAPEESKSSNNPFKPSAREQIHIVKPGDIFSKIIEDYYGTQQKSVENSLDHTKNSNISNYIAQYNNIKSIGNIPVGLKIKLPVLIIEPDSPEPAFGPYENPFEANFQKGEDFIEQGNCKDAKKRFEAANRFKILLKLKDNKVLTDKIEKFQVSEKLEKLKENYVDEQYFMAELDSLLEMLDQSDAAQTESEIWKYVDIQYNCQDCNEKISSCGRIESPVTYSASVPKKSAIIKKNNEEDQCPDDPYKTKPGVCGCGTPDKDTDNDGILDCKDKCPKDPLKSSPGVCGCGVADEDKNGDGVMDCKQTGIPEKEDKCPDDPEKTDPGKCGCGKSDIDTDNDGIPDCNDKCSNDPKKTVPGKCGCNKDENCLDKKEMEALYEECVKKFSQGNLNDAIEGFNKLYKEEPNYKDIKLYLYRSYLGRIESSYVNDLNKVKRYYNTMQQYKKGCSECKNKIKEFASSHLKKGNTYYNDYKSKDALIEWKLVAVISENEDALKAIRNEALKNIGIAENQ